MKYRIKEFWWEAAYPYGDMAFTAEQSEDGQTWTEVPTFPLRGTLAAATRELDRRLKPIPEPIYHPYP